MCVIFAVDRVRPTDDMIDKAWAKNDDGGGLAWRERNEDGEAEVVWTKGIDTLSEMKRLMKELPLPFIAHFRIASASGGGIRPELTHPFPVDKATSLALDGRTKGSVLFHNGDWRGWSDKTIEAAIRSNTPIPKGRWSDTRAMAWLCSIYGEGFMEFLPEQKGVIFGPEGDFEIFTGYNGWNEVNGVWCSNDYFWPSTRAYSTVQNNTPTICRFGSCRNRNIDTQGFCPDHLNGIIQSTLKKELGPAPTLPLVTSPSTTNAATGGSSTPFLEAGLIPLVVVERAVHWTGANGKALVSKNQVKKFREAYQKLASKNPKKSAAARRVLRSLSQKLISNGLKV